MNTNKTKIYLAIIVVIWFLSHFFTINWGMPNYGSFASDTAPAYPSRNAREIMRGDSNKYPPLQYLIWSIFSSADNTQFKDFKTETAVYSKRLVIFRWVVAVMTLLTCLIIYFACSAIFQKSALSIIPPLAYLLLPKSLFFSHTSNMDQPYIFWLTASVFVFYLANLKYENEKKKKYLLNALFAIFMACSFTTKDQVYGIYLIPLIVFVFWQFKEKKRAKEIAILCCSWIIPFSLTLLIIFLLMGEGSLEAAYEHYGYLLGSYGGATSTTDAQFANSFSGRFQLLLKSFQDFLLCLDWPVILFAVCAIPFGLRKLKEDKLMKIFLLTSVLMFFSYQILFIQHVRFSEPRYYMPFAIPVLMITFYSFAAYLNENTKIKTILTISFLFPIFVIGSQQLFLLKNDSRQQAKIVIQKLNEQQKRLIKVAVNGMQIGYKLKFNGDKHKKITAIRNWEFSRFGILSDNQESILLNKLNIYLAEPELILVWQDLEDSKKKLIESTGFKLTGHIYSPKPYPFYLSLTKFNSPVFSVYERNVKILPIPFDDIKKMSFHEQLMTYQASCEAHISVNKMTRFGLICKDFEEPKQEEFNLKLQTINRLAIAYDLNDRINQAKKAFSYLIKYSKNPNHINNAKKFHKKNNVKIH